MICEREDITPLVAPVIDFGNASFFKNNYWYNMKIKDLGSLRRILVECPLYVHAKLFNLENSFSKFVDLFPTLDNPNSESAESLLKNLNLSLNALRMILSVGTVRN